MTTKGKISPTGRWVCHGPNTQQIPIRTPEGAAIRAAFVGKMHKIPDADAVLSSVKDLFDQARKERLAKEANKY